MRAIGVIIRDVVLDETAQVSLVEDEYVIQKISATAADPAFRHSILPRACWAYASGFHAAGCKQIGFLLAELAITIENRVAVRTRLRKCLPQLLHYPGAGRVFRDIEMEDLASTVFPDEETMQDPQGQGRHGEKVHGGDGVAVIAQESCPELGGGDPGAGDSERQYVRRRRSRVSEAHREFVERPSSDSPLSFSG